ncbi:MAG: ABC transporter permease, partial [Lachnospiraceae bacterium]|nr:ABC transporter permease [Lachnospiraceae bacterium]
MNFYQLELMKIRLSTYLWAILGIFASLLALGILFLFIFQTETATGEIAEDAELFANWNGLFALTTALAFACFSILSAVIAAKVIVNEYCSKNAVILLSYPVSRKTILQTKCRIVCGITTFSAAVSNVLVIGMMYITAQVFKTVPQMNTDHFALTVLLSSILMGIASSALGVIATVIGMNKRSKTAPIISALLIVCVVTNTITISPNHM